MAGAASDEQPRPSAREPGHLVLTADAARVVLGGELDLRSAPSLGSLLDEAFAAGPPVVVDMAGVTFVDSTVMRVLLRAHHAGRAAGRAPRIHGLSGHPRRMVELAGLHLTLDLDDGPT